MVIRVNFRWEKKPPLPNRTGSHKKVGEKDAEKGSEVHVRFRPPMLEERSLNRTIRLKGVGKTSKRLPHWGGIQVLKGARNEIKKGRFTHTGGNNKAKAVKMKPIRDQSKRRRGEKQQKERKHDHRNENLIQGKGVLKKTGKGA